MKIALVLSLVLILILGGTGCHPESQWIEILCSVTTDGGVWFGDEPPYQYEENPLVRPLGTVLWGRTFLSIAGFRSLGVEVSFSSDGRGLAASWGGTTTVVPWETQDAAGYPLVAGEEEMLLNARLVLQAVGGQLRFERGSYGQRPTLVVRLPAVGTAE
jgi:hypothetical protein